ncbi:MAG TPA: dTMP kinase [Bryobacteraceae bacterium]|nr:dTMP kinase [Bryobacteraceae bacterium]
MSAGDRGVFLVFEGIDGSGTSTQAALLTANLRAAGRRVLATSEPSHGPVGQLIRSYFSGRLASSFTREAQDKFYGCLFAADRLDHVFNPVDGVLKQLASGVDVVCTRYKFSSLAYNAETEEERSFVLKANSELPDPDLLVYLNCPFEVALQRMRERITQETYEKDKEKLQKALVNFDDEVGQFEGPKLVLDASLPANQLALAVIDFVREHHPGLQSGAHTAGRL